MAFKILSFVVSTPIEMRLTPYFLAINNLLFVKDSGLASIVYSLTVPIYLAKCESNISNRSSSNAVGVPPPIYMVLRFFIL